MIICIKQQQKIDIYTEFRDGCNQISNIKCNLIEFNLMMDKLKKKNNNLMLIRIFVNKFKKI